MADSPPAPPPDGPDGYASTVGWPAADDAVRRDLDSEAPTHAVPAYSTSGPEAPGRATPPDPTDHLTVTETGLPRLPDVSGYDVQQRIGHGGMGVVYRAHHLVTGRTVAIKIITPTGAHDETSRQRFTREIHSLAAVKHPNIVPVYDAGDWHGFPYYSMEFIGGGTLSQHLDRIRADRRHAIQLLAKVAHAVAALHAAGVLHRDLKPLNILLGENDEPMVADFGLAKWLESGSELTYTGFPVGTRQYMSPEQTRGGPDADTPASDIWALGVILYELLAGERPFKDDGRTDLFQRIREHTPDPATAFGPDVPRELIAVAFKCLAKQPADRYPTAAAVAADLERWLAGEPVSASLPAPAKSRKARRARVLLAGAAVALVAVVVAAASGVFRDRPTEPPTELEVPKSIAGRVAATEHVKLTNDKGKPLVPVLAIAGHKLFEEETNGFHTFTKNGMGLAHLADVEPGMPVRVEAEVAMRYETTEYTLGGIYVARRAWPGAGFQHDSLIYFTVSPRYNAATKKRERSCVAGLYWWYRDLPGSLAEQAATTQPWSKDGTADQPEFVPVVIDIRDKEIHVSMGGEQLRPVKESLVLEELNRKPGQRPGFPQYQFTPPAFGTGIGIVCRTGSCAVRNLTVSKLTP